MSPYYVMFFFFPANGWASTVCKRLQKRQTATCSTRMRSEMSICLSIYLSACVSKVLKGLKREERMDVVVIGSVRRIEGRLRFFQRCSPGWLAMATESGA
jgi:hypothetical protein